MTLSRHEPEGRPSPGGPMPGGRREDEDRGDALTAGQSALLARLRDPGPLTAGQAAALARLDDPAGPDPDDPAYLEDPECGAPDWWLALPATEQARQIEADLSPETRVPEAIAAGFTHRDGGHGTGFGAGGSLDTMLPGTELARHVGRVQRDPAALADDALIGALAANRRQLSLYQAVEYKLVAELDARRAQADGREGEHVDAELGAALTLTPRSSRIVLEYARQLERLAPTRALLAAGVIDTPRAELIARRLEPLSDEHAAKVQDAILPRVSEMTTGRLSDALQTAIKKVDPEAARRRKEKALEDARVECFAEDAGTAALAGRDLPAAEVLAADKRIDAAARWLKTHGTDGTLEQLRAKVFLALLNGQPLYALLPEPAPAPAAPAPGLASAGTGSADDRRSPADTGSVDTGSVDTGSVDTGSAGTGAAATTDTGWPAGLTGSVHLTMPASAFTGRSEHPGEIAGFGAADADTCRDVAARLAAGKAHWCITLTDGHGRPVGHGCARAGPPPRGDPASWLAKVKITPIETATCSHRREAAGYRIPDSLRHLIKVRSRRCGFPGCRRPAVRCDDDHTIPYHLGGRSCECNLYPLCRQHHRAKQAPGWHLEQPEPGRLIWTSPSGRRYPTTAEPYPI